jgi:hypothetical protein
MLLFSFCRATQATCLLLKLSSFQASIFPAYELPSLIMLLIDAHVHIYDCFDLEKFFDSAYANLKFEAEQLDHGNDFTGILILAETSNENWFQHLVDCANGKPLPDGKTTGNWNLRRTDERNSLLAVSGDSKNLLLIAGRQIVTEEGLEILSLASNERFEDGSPIKNLIEDIKDKGGIPVIPWGVGKWFGTKGKIIKELVDNYQGNASIYLGDNGNRPVFWRQPKHLKEAMQKGIIILPGSDPLPFASESCRAGRYGFILQTEIDSKNPAALIMQILMNEVKPTVRVFGRLEKIHRFLQNQIRAQFRKRFAGISLH